MTKLFGLLLVLGMLSSLRSNGQVKEQSFEQKILKRGIVGKTFVSGKWNKDNEGETHLTYLGQVVTNAGRTYKIVTSAWIWGMSQRATSRILIFDKNNFYFGNYYLTTMSDLPTRLSKGRLIFRNTDKECDPQVMTIIDLKHGLPNEFIKRCNGKFGDLCTLDTVSFKRLA